MVENRPRLVSVVLLGVVLGLVGGLSALTTGCSATGSTPLMAQASRLQRSIDLGPVSRDASLDFVVGLSLRSATSFAKVLEDRPRPGEGLLPDEFVRRFSPTASDYQQVVAWLRAGGLTVSTTSSRTTVTAHGTALAVERLFGVPLHQYRDGSDIFVAAAAPLRIAPQIIGTINGVVGLSGSPSWRSHISDWQPHAATAALKAADLQTLYNTGSIVNPGLGETVAILGAGIAPPLVDVKKYYATVPNALAAANYEQVLVDGANLDGMTNGQQEEIENALDAEMVLAMAPQAHVVHVVAASSGIGMFTDGISYIVNNVSMAHSVSVSFGGCERGSAAEMPVFDTLMQQAQAQGQQWFFSSGDTGADGCRLGAANDHISAGWPSTSPYVVGVGGTMFDASHNNAEIAWNETSPADGVLAGGGGPSEDYVKPAFQMGLSPADGARDTPDVAAIAGTPGVTIDVLNTSGQVRGTSVAAPVWGGIWALVDQAHGGTGLTDALTRIYAAAGSPGFTDITVGDIGGPNGTGAGFPAGVGYDLSTGLGAPNVAKLVTSIK